MLHVSKIGCIHPEIFKYLPTPAIKSSEMSPCCLLIGQSVPTPPSHWSGVTSYWMTHSQGEEERSGIVYNFMQFLVVKWKCWNLCILHTDTDIQRLSLKINSFEEWYLTYTIACIVSSQNANSYRQQRQRQTYYCYCYLYLAVPLLWGQMSIIMLAPLDAGCATAPHSHAPRSAQGAGRAARESGREDKSWAEYLNIFSAEGRIYKSKLMFA